MNCCPECHQPITNMCFECGVCFDEPEYVVSDLQNYMPRHKRYYNRLDHFKEVLNQYQGKEGRDIPDHIVQRVKDEVERNPIGGTRQALRKLRMTKYVENANYLDFIILSKPLPYIPRLIEDKLIRYFKYIDRVFAQLLQSAGKSFMSYHYVIYKLLELIGERELMTAVPLLKTKARLKQHDRVWLLLCQELGWSFVPTL